MDERSSREEGSEREREESGVREDCSLEPQFLSGPRHLGIGHTKEKETFS